MAGNGGVNGAGNGGAIRAGNGPPQDQAWETGRWSARHNRWIPQQRGTDDPDFSVSRYEDTGDVTAERQLPGQGRVLDHNDWYEVTREYRPPLPAAPLTGYSARYRRAVERRRPGDVYYSGRPYPRARPADWQELPEEPDGQNYVGAMLATIVWYALPLVAYVAWAVLLPGQPPNDCVDALGAPCPAPRAEALRNLVNNIPLIAMAMALSILVAMLLRRVTLGWRSITIGFAAAVVGAGAMTVVYSVMST